MQPLFIALAVFMGVMGLSLLGAGAMCFNMTTRPDGSAPRHPRIPGLASPPNYGIANWCTLADRSRDRSGEELAYAKRRSYLDLR